jgi:hypothetical protein
LSLTVLQPAGISHIRSVAVLLVEAPPKVNPEEEIAPPVAGLSPAGAGAEEDPALPGRAVSQERQAVSKKQRTDLDPAWNCACGAVNANNESKCLKCDKRRSTEVMAAGWGDLFPDQHKDQWKCGVRRHTHHTSTDLYVGRGTPAPNRR